MVVIKDKERAIIEFTCIPEVNIETAQKLFDVGFRHLRELLEYSLDKEAKSKGLVDILNHRILSQFLTLEDEDIPSNKFKCPFCKAPVFADEEECSDCGALLLEEILEVEMEDVFKGLKEMIDKTLEMGIVIYVCEASKQMLGWEKVDLIPGVKIVGAGTLNDLALDAGATMWF